MTDLKKPCLVEVTVGKHYLWCACGRSKTQPFCDGSHAGTAFKPVKYRADEDGEILFCGCKQTASPPFCDGSHNNLSDTYAEADPTTTADVETVPRAANGGKTMLDGGCFVRVLNFQGGVERGNMKISPLISAGDGARYLSVYGLCIEAGTTPPLSMGASEVAIFVISGSGTAQIAGRSFSFGDETSLYVRPGEIFSIDNSGDEAMEAIAVACPQNDGPSWPEEITGTFNNAFEERAIGINLERREAMADRFFQVLIGTDSGDDAVQTEATMFIGDVPKSRAEIHHHLYEEVVTVLSGEGVMWTGKRKTVVGPGDVIFLPKKQEHSLECTSDDGLHLLGVFYPAGSPAINY